MKIETVSAALKELGHLTRLQIYKYLIEIGKNGQSMGEIQRSFDIPASTLNHHITALVSVNLVEQKRQGRIIYCIAKYNTLENIISFLQENCCKRQENST